MKKLLIILASIIFISACTNPNDAKSALSSLGFEDIELTGYRWLSCSDDDFYHTGFIARNSQGKLVSGTVCSGVLFKNSTVRFD